MTSFMAWVGVDQRSPSSIYFASDSRISWHYDLVVGVKQEKIHKHDIWNYGKKLFASKSSPDILGYVGDAFFLSIVLGQIIDLIDEKVLYSNNATFEEKFNCVCTHIKNSFKNFPATQKGKEVSVYYATRDGEKMNSSFYLGVLKWTKTRGWEVDIPEMPEHSSMILPAGSGSSYIKKWQDIWNKTSQGNTSRSAFSGFCDSLRDGKDSNSGGAPQLVGIYRKEPAKSFGVIFNGSPYLSGLKVNQASIDSKTEWRNEIFELCLNNGSLKENAKKHHVPKGLGS